MWSDFFKAGGWGMYPTTLFGFLMIAATLLYTLRPSKKAANLATLLGVITFSAGMLGTVTGMCMSAHYIDQLPTEKQVMALAFGCEESAHNLVLALILVIVAGLVAAGGTLRRSIDAGLTNDAKTGD